VLSCSLSAREFEKQNKESTFVKETRNSSLIDSPKSSSRASPHASPRASPRGGYNSPCVQDILDKLAPFTPPFLFYSLTPPSVSSLGAAFIASALPGDSIIRRIVDYSPTITPSCSVSPVPVSSPNANATPLYPQQEYFHPTASARTQQGLPPRIYRPYSRSHAPLIPCNHNCSLVGFFESWRLKFQVVYHCGHQRFSLLWFIELNNFSVVGIFLLFVSAHCKWNWKA
jgi:hypothetical protein